VSIYRDVKDSDDDDLKLARARDALLLTLLTHQPPDRVGVARQLQLGGTLKRTAEGTYVLDLSQPDAHKTAAVFGPVRTTMSASIAHWIDIYLDLHDGELRAGDYLFHQADRARELSSSQWTRLVKACFHRHAGVALAPKDLRASFITFLRSSDHSDATLRAAAYAMRHSSRTQESVAYDKGQGDRLVEAAVRAAEGYAAKFG
jgi:hypothetical protein